MPALIRRPWVPSACEDLMQTVAGKVAASDVEALSDEVDRLVELNRTIHERDCINLNPAGNAMNPRAERMLSAGLGSRPSLGYPGNKYEMGLEAVEQIEVIAAELAAEIFAAKYVEIRVAAGSMANLYAFMATCAPGDAIIAPVDGDMNGLRLGTPEIVRWGMAIGHMPQIARFIARALASDAAAAALAHEVAGFRQSFPDLAFVR